MYSFGGKKTDTAGSTVGTSNQRIALHSGHVFTPALTRPRVQVPISITGTSTRSGIGSRSVTSSAKQATFTIDYSYPESKDVIEPTSIIGSYRTDINIVKIHETIRDIFSFYRYNAVAFTDEIRSLTECVDKDITILESIARKRRAVTLKERVENFSEKSWYHYVESVKDLLDRYLTVTSYGKSKSFTFGPSTSENVPEERESDEKISTRLDIIDQYRRVAENFIEINVIFIPQPRVGCTECGQHVDEMEVNDEQGNLYCACGVCFDQVYSAEAPHQDPDRIEVSSRSAYEDKTNFIRRLNAYQGIQERDIPQELLDILDLHFQSNCGIQEAAIIRELPLDEYGHRGEETSVRLLEDGLRKTNNTQYYKDMDLIAHRLWGWKLPDISHLVQTILDDYSRTQEIYREIKPNGSSINVNLRLYWHLRAAGYNCRLEDFKIPSSSESLKSQSELFKTMCEQTEVKFYHII